MASSSLIIGGLSFWFLHVLVKNLVITFEMILFKMHANINSKEKGGPCI